jgi:hypothetical protein
MSMMDSGRRFRLSVFLLIIPIFLIAIQSVSNAFDFKVSTFQDPETKITFYIESDRHHVAAIAPSGRLLWVRDPFVDSKVPYYRGPQHSPIWSVGVANTGYERQMQGKGGIKFVEVKFVSSQYGLMNQATGQFIFLGQN